MSVKQSVLFDDDTIEFLRSYAERTGTNLSTAIRKLVLDGARASGEGGLPTASDQGFAEGWKAGRAAWTRFLGEAEHEFRATLTSDSEDLDTSSRSRPSEVHPGLNGHPGE